ncbi:MAG TPA: amino acid ABC transporter permease [Candidatus Atribacteria bacterium]|nr:amino acid ABC transporter permease [Candidatus Atribacteria bacterium]HPT79501.1 amino acid ABC transporter permease [Candidatus Atribacteria bacterium]
MAFIDGLFKLLSDEIYFNLIRESRYELFLKGLLISLQLTFCSALVGGVIGLFVALARLTHNKPLNYIATKYIDIIRGTPAVVQLLIIYYAVLAQTSLPRVTVASIAFGINSGAYVAELIRAGIQAVDKGQMEAARSLGLSYGRSMTYIIIPQAIKNILPAMGNEVITLWKETAIAGFIGLDDLMRGAEIVRGRTFSNYTPYIVIAIIYFYITLLLTQILGRVERRMRQSD